MGNSLGGALELAQEDRCSLGGESGMQVTRTGGAGKAGRGKAKRKQERWGEEWPKIGSIAASASRPALP